MIAKNLDLWTILCLTYLRLLENPPKNASYLEGKAKREYS